MKFDGLFDYSGGGIRARVDRVEDEISLNADTNFSDKVEVDESGGKLIIRRRAKYDGSLSYQGYFEYPADGTKHYDGTLDYNNIIADGRTKFNGEERYGGRADSDYNEQVIDFDDGLPIATHSRLGYVIAGENLDIDDSGLITLPKRFTSRMTALESGKLLAIFEN